jgi:rhodanese-related sulfurtransferase
LVQEVTVLCRDAAGRRGVVDPEGQEVRIDIEQAREKLESGEAVVLDVVQPGAWDRMDGVVKGAVRIPPEEIEQRFQELPRDLGIVAYCT